MTHPQQQPYGQQQQPPPPGQWGPPQGHPAAYPPAPPAKKKRRKGPIIALAILAVIVLFFVGCMAVVGKAANDVASSMPGGQAATVLYEITGTGKAQNVTYNTDGDAGGISQEGDVALPWKKELTFKEGSFRVATLSAQNAGGGELTCRITVDGKVVREATSSGQYAVVSCASEAF